MAGKKSKRINKPVIPEPSPRFIKWFAIGATAMLIGILAFDYTVGAAHFRAPQPLAHGTHHKNRS